MSLVVVCPACKFYFPDQLGGGGAAARCGHEVARTGGGVYPFVGEARARSGACGPEARLYVPLSRTLLQRLGLKP
jgi:hypothetical protein